MPSRKNSKKMAKQKIVTESHRMEIRSNLVASKRRRMASRRRKTPAAALARALRMSDRNLQKPQLLHEIGDTFLLRFQDTMSEKDINNSLRAYELAVQLLPATDTRLAGYIQDYGISAGRRYDLKGITEDINTSISAIRNAIQLTPDTQQLFLAFRLDHLGISLQRRFDRTGHLPDISEAILLQRRVVQLTPDGHAILPTRLNHLGLSLYRRFARTGHLPDISEAILLQQKVVQLTPEGHVDLPSGLNNLAGSLYSRFGHTRHLPDISEAILLMQRVVQLTPEGHVDLPSRLNHFGASLCSRFNHTRHLPDISEAILLQQKSVQLTPEGHVDLPSRLNHLGASLCSRFNHTRHLPDISEAILLQQKVVQLTPEGHAILPSGLNNLGASLCSRFNHTRHLPDISEAILLQQKSVQLTPEGHVDLPSRLNYLGASLCNRFNHTRHLPDISEAILLMQRVVQLTPEGHADLPSRLNHLGASLCNRFNHTRHLPDISEAILLQQKSVQLTPEGHVDLPSRLNYLGASLCNRFNHTRHLPDISEAILLLQRAVQLTPEGHADLPSRLSSLGASLDCRFSRTGHLPDISEAILLQQQSIQLIPEGHADMPHWLHYLGLSFRVRFHHTQDEADIILSISHHQKAAVSISGRPLTRLWAAKAWIYWSQIYDRSQLLQAYHTAVGLISQVAGLDQLVEHRYATLVDVSEISAAAAGAALDFTQHSLALEWLEQGRCLIWSQLTDLRTPIEDLRAHYPVLASDIVRVSRTLENASSRAEPAAFTEETSMETKIAVQEEAHTHITLAQEWDQLLMKVRELPQFEHFLRPASCSSLLTNIPKFGHVVVINIHENRSDALALTFGAEEPHHIPLPEFTYKQADGLRHQLKAILQDSNIRIRGFELDDTRGSRRYTAGIADILKQLWLFVVKPILDGLGYSVPAYTLPRIWWCATGPLTFLPVHAAGIYSVKPAPGIYTSLSDFAVSSYTPTVRSLVAKIRQPREIPKANTGMLMISQPDTPKMCRIPGTIVEVGAIQRLLADHKIQHQRLDSREATVTKVKTAMESYSSIHLACHASQDTTKPLQSGFSLYDGRLALADIIRENLTGAELAFLSACQTSTGDEKLSEEAVHLAGGMLAVGYRGVVATMWSIKDFYGPKVADEFYKHLLSHGPVAEDGSRILNSEGAAHALHHSIQQLRKSLGNSEASLLTWVPYVHFGL